MKFEEQFTSLKNKHSGDSVEALKGDEYVHVNLYSETVLKEHCLDKQRVKDIIKKRIEKFNPILAEDYDFAYDVLKELGLDEE